MRHIAPIAVALAAVPLLAFGPTARTAPTHWAVIIGISDYIHFDDEPGGDLPGAENDARGVRDVLISRYDFPEENVLMVLNHEATRAGIESAFTEWLPERVRPGDQVTVFYAGHGSQMWDESGDEDDGLDETLAPADVNPSSTELDISDDDFGGWLTSLATDNVVVFLDNCSSGTGTRDVTPFSRTRELGRDIESLEKPASVARRALPGQEDESGFDAGGARILELAAAQPNQAAVDAFFPGEPGTEAFHGGAFTTYLIRELWRAPADMTYEQAFRRVAEALERNRFEQDPHLSQDVASKSLPLFFVDGGSTTTSEALLPVASVMGSTVELRGGQALGITTGSTFVTESGARLVIEGVTRESATARVMSGQPVEDEGARLEGYRFGASDLRVSVAGIDSRTGDALSRLLGSVDGIVLLSDEEAYADLLLRRRGNLIRIVGMDGAARHVLPGGPEGAEALSAAIRQEAAAKRLADMENLAQSFELAVELDGGQRSLGLGEIVRFNAWSDRDGYLTLVDLGPDGTVTMLFPNPYDRDNRVRAGERVTFPSESMDSEIVAQLPTGRGMVRAFLTPLPLDVPVGDDFTFGQVPFADQVAEAVKLAAGTVDGSSEAVRVDTWGSASIVYEIRQ